MLKPDLWSRYHKRLSVVAEHLPPQDVEIVGRGRALRQLEVDVTAIKGIIEIRVGIICL